MADWVFRTIDWDMEAQKNLLPAIDRDPLASINTLKNDCQKGWCKLFGVFKNGNRAGSFVLRKEYNENVYELVVVAGGGVVGVEGLKASFAFFRKEAEKIGADYIRMHVVRSGLMKLLKNDGYKEAERVYRTRV